MTQGWLQEVELPLGKSPVRGIRGSGLVEDWLARGPRLFLGSAQSPLTRSPGPHAPAEVLATACVPTQIYFKIVVLSTF